MNYEVIGHAFLPIFDFLLQNVKIITIDYKNVHSMSGPLKDYDSCSSGLFAIVYTNKILFSCT